MYRRLWGVFRASLLTGFVWNALAIGSAQGSLFLGHLVVARVLGVADFGRYALLLTTALAIGAIAQSGIGFVAAKYIAEHRTANPARAANVLAMCRFAALALGVGCGLLLFVGASFIATHVLAQANLASGLRVLGLVVPMLSLAAYQQGALQGLEGFRASGITGTITGSLHVALAWAGSALGGLDGALWAMLLSATVRVVLLSGVLRAVTRAWPKVPVRTALAGEGFLLLRIGLPAALMGAATAATLWLVNVLIAQQHGGNEAVGQFYAANQLRLLALQLPTVLVGVSVSVLNRIRGQAEWSSYRSVFFSSLAFHLLCGIVFGCVLAVLARPLMAMYGPAFVESATVLQWLALSLLPELLTVALFVHLQAQERVWLAFGAIWLPKDLIFVGATALLLPTIELNGAAVAYGAAWLVGGATCFALVRRYGMTPTAKRH